MKNCIVPWMKKYNFMAFIFLNVKSDKINYIDYLIRNSLNIVINGMLFEMKLLRVLNQVNEYYKWIVNFEKESYVSAWNKNGNNM
jgi:hypothetical protein